MYKSLVILSVLYCVVIEARPKWQFLPPVPGYVPVYIRAGDTPLEEINPDLAEAFHAFPAGRSAGKQLEASAEIPEQPQGDQPQPEEPSHKETSYEELSHEDLSHEEPSQEKPNPEKPQDIPEPDSIIDRRPYEKKILEKKKKATADVPKPIERR